MLFIQLKITLSCKIREFRDRPHGTGDFTRSLSLLPQFSEQLSLLFLKSHQIHVACFRVKTVEFFKKKLLPIQPLYRFY